MVNEKLKKYDRAKRTNETTYRSLVGSLLYLTTTQLDVMFAASLLSRFMNSLSQLNSTIVKRVLRYIKGTTDYDIWYKLVENLKWIDYIDSDWVGCIDDMKNTSGYVFSLGSGL